MHMQDGQIIPRARCGTQFTAVESVKKKERRCDKSLRAAATSAECGPAEMVLSLVGTAPHLFRHKPISFVLSDAHAHLDATMYYCQGQIIKAHMYVYFSYAHKASWMSVDDAPYLCHKGRLTWSTRNGKRMRPLPSTGKSFTPLHHIASPVDRERVRDNGRSLPPRSAKKGCDFHRVLCVASICFCLV